MYGFMCMIVYVIRNLIEAIYDSDQFVCSSIDFLTIYMLCSNQITYFAISFSLLLLDLLINLFDLIFLSLTKLLIQFEIYVNLF